MSDYSYTELQNMQQKAMARVRQMQKNSEEIRDKAQEDLGSTPSKDRSQMPQFHSPQVTPRVTNMPPNFPENSQYPSFNDFFSGEQKQTPSAPKKEKKPVQSKSNTLENLFAEPDKAMLMGLVMLLKSEGADEMLIMALIYIMS